MANELITNEEFALWTQTELAVIQADEFAQDIRTKASDLIRAKAEQPTWTIADAPFEARLIVLKVAKRTYLNPDQEVSTTTGPISSRVLDEAAMAMSLTEEELASLDAMKPSGGVAGGLWTLGLGRGPVEMQTAFIPDNTGSDWWIPYGDMAESDFFNEPEDTFIP